MIPNIHDHTLLGYRISLDRSEIALRTSPTDRKFLKRPLEQEILFKDGEAHHFEHVCEGTILSELFEIPIERFVSEHAAQFQAGWRQSGWPTSSYGMSGWILARQVLSSSIYANRA